MVGSTSGWMTEPKEPTRPCDCGRGSFLNHCGGSRPIGSSGGPSGNEYGRTPAQRPRMPAPFAAPSTTRAWWAMRNGATTLAEVEETRQVGVQADRAVEWLRALSETWDNADVPQARSELLHAIYERLVIAGREFVSARLTPEACSHGLALALPERWLWRARQDSDL